MSRDDAPDPDCWLCGGTGEIQSQHHDGRAAIGCVCRKGVRASRRSALRLAELVNDAEEGAAALRARAFEAEDRLSTLRRYHEESMAAMRAEVERLNAERGQWQESSGQNYVRAQEAEAREESLRGEVERLTRAVQEAPCPHEMHCVGVKNDPSTMHNPRVACDCWKREALKREAGDV